MGVGFIDWFMIDVVGFFVVIVYRVVICFIVLNWIFLNEIGIILREFW